MATFIAFAVGVIAGLLRDMGRSVAFIRSRALGPVRAWVGQGALGYRWLVRLEPAAQVERH